MLDIIITHYKEPWEVCRKLFWMIDLQRMVDWEQITVTVVNDGGFRLPEERLAELHYPVHQLDIPHGGISAARNAGMENAKGEWIMYCDCDDTYENIYALRDIQNILSKEAEERFDMLWCKCTAEDNIKNTDLLYVIPEKQVFVFCHGKIYRRRFLMDEGIRFDTSLTFNEDSHFNAVIIARTPHTRIGQVRTHAPAYSWIRRGNSVTTREGVDDEAELNQFHRNLMVTEENRLHRGYENYCGMVTRTAYDVYYMMYGKRLTMRGKRRIYDEFAPWIRERRTAFGQVPPEILDQIREISRMELLEPGEIVPDSHETVAEWVRKTVEVTG